MAQLSVKAPKEPPLFRIGPFKGINLSATPTQIDDNESSDMLNFLLDERGALNKRTGYERVFTTSLGVGNINGLFNFRKLDGSTVFLIAHGTQLYTQSGNNQPVSIYTGLANAKVKFFVMGNKCYLQDGANYLVYDGTAVSTVTPYIPKLTVSREPSGGGTFFEDFNLIGEGFKDSFSSDGIATEYQLSLKGLDATTVTALVDEVVKTEGTGFTVNRTTGKVTFTTAPAKGTNNVIITAYKTQGLEHRIKKCRFNVIYGGSNDTRVFIAGNPDEPNTVWRSGLADPTYWPENGFYPFPDTVKGFSKQYDYLVVERENGMHMVSFTINEDGTVSFPSKPINDQVGTVAEDSIQLIDNNPVSLSNTGVYILKASTIRDERNIEHISENVDSRLLTESNLENAVSIDFDKKYWLAVNGNVYVYDYAIEEWYIFDNIHATCFLVMDSTLYFGADGLVYRFKKSTENLPYNDDGALINAYWYSKLIYFKYPERYKLVTRVFHTIKPDVHTSSNLYIRTDKKGETLVNIARMDQISFFDLDFDKFSFITSDIPQEVAKKVKEKKITHFQLKLENNALDESLGIIDVGIKFNYQNEVK